MAKFNTSATKSATGTSALSTTGQTGINHEGGLGYDRNTKSELFLAAVSDFMGDTFYEARSDRTKRTVDLVHKVAVEDPEWIRNFTQWIRGEGNMRSISLLVALESAKAMVEAGIPGSRRIVASAIQRADEPGEALGYWMSHYGRTLPSAVKRGIADGVVSTYNQYSLPKYDSKNSAFRFSDVIRLTHPKPKDSTQADLFKYAMEKNFDPKTEAPDSLEKIKARQALLAMDKEDLKKIISSEDGFQKIQEAGLTWESVASAVGLSKEIWGSLIPNMGYMALLRNLRNFREYEVDPEIYSKVLDRLSSRDEVVKSRQFPFRFLSAYYANKDHLRTASALEDALNHSLENVPSLPGKTLILVDRSASMDWDRESDLSFADMASLFGIALAVRAKSADLVEFGTDSRKISFNKSDSILTTLHKFSSMGGTETAKAVRKWYDGSYDRVINLTDEQDNFNYYYRGPVEKASDIISDQVPYYVFNLAGYKYAEKMDGHNRHTFGGLTDQCFRLIPLLESGKSASWLWDD